MDPKVHYRVNNGWQLVATVSQINLVHTIPFDFSKISFNITKPYRLDL